MSLLIQYEKLYQIPNLKERSLFLATEDTGTFLQSVGSFFTSKIQAIKEFFTPESQAYKIKTDPFIGECYKIYKSNEKELNGINYMTVAKLRTPWPELFCKNLYDTSLVINNLTAELNKVFMKAIDDTDTLISKAVQDLDFLKSSRPIPNKVERDKVIEVCYKGLDTILDKERRQDTVTVQEAIPNITTIRDVVMILQEIQNLSMYKDAIKADKIAKSIREKIDTLVNDLNRSKSQTISKIGLSNLASELESSAKLITLLSTLLYVTSQTAETTTAMIKTIVGKPLR